MAGEYRWVCLTAAFDSKSSEPKALLEREVRVIFGEDLRSVVVVLDQRRQMFGDHCFVFVECRNYAAHVEQLRQSRAIVAVVPEYDNPSFVPPHEVAQFDRSVRLRGRPARLYAGDIVTVTSGYLSDLKGIVLREASPTSYYVIFRFHVRSFVEIISADALEHDGNVFDHVRVPVVFYGIQSPDNCTLSGLVDPEALNAYMELCEDGAIRQQGCREHTPCGRGCQGVPDSALQH